MTFGKRGHELNQGGAGDQGPISARDSKIYIAKLQYISESMGLALLIVEVVFSPQHHGDLNIRDAVHSANPKIFETKARYVLHCVLV